MKTSPHAKPAVSELLIKPSSGTNRKNLVPIEERKQLKFFRFYMDGFKKGVPTSELVRKFSEEYEVTVKDAQWWRDKALEALSHYAVKDAEQIRSLQMERLEHIYNLAVEGHQLKTAQSILDTMNKLMGLYKESNVIIQPVTEFNFGDGSTFRATTSPYATELDGVETEEDINSKAKEIMDDLTTAKWRQENL